jgi:hypothetical protein
VLLFPYPERARLTLELIDHDIEHHRDPPPPGSRESGMES